MDSFREEYYRSSNKIFTSKPSEEQAKELIRKEVQRQTSLTDVKSKVISANPTPLICHPLDVEFVERHYIEYCFEFWLEDTVDAIKTITDKKMLVSLLTSLVPQIYSIYHLENVCEPWNFSEFYHLLLKHKVYISDATEKEQIRIWKMECMKSLRSVTSLLEKEVAFIEAFSDVLFSINNKTHLESFQTLICSKKELKFYDLYDKIMRLSSLLKPKDLINFKKIMVGINLHDEMHMQKLLLDMIVDINKPPEFYIEKVDGRKVIHISSTNLIMSEIIMRVEHELVNDPEITEVHFISRLIIHADVNLPKDIWHGKNIVLVSNIVKTSGKVIWNVSGQDNDHVYAECAGTDHDGNGLKGEDGFAGESGGNVLIQADRIDCSSELCVISNGGRGSTGQNGGPGRKGIAGYGITKNKFDTKFPPSCKLFNKSYEKIRGAFVQSDIDNKIISWKLVENIYLQGKIHGGFDALFVARSRYRAFVVCYGIPAVPAGRGGEFGLGGEGGHAGDIEGIVGEGQAGQAGNNGDGGVYGQPAKNGWDMGYMDFFKVWGIGSKTQHLGISENSKLTVERYSHSGKNHVWCEHLQLYLTISESKVDHRSIQQFSDRHSTRTHFERQFQAKATRKKTISKTKICEKYAKYINASTDVFRTCKLEIDKINTTISEMYSNLQQESKKTYESKFKIFLTKNYNSLRTPICMGNVMENSHNAICNNSVLFESFIAINKDLVSQMQQKVFTKHSELFFPKIIIKCKQDRNISNQSYGSLDKYLYKTDVDDIALILNSVKDDQNGPLFYGIKNYIVTNANSEDRGFICQYQRYCQFLKDQKIKLNNDLKLFIDEFSQPKYKELRKLFLKCVTKSFEINNFEYELENHRNLNNIYDNINECLKEDYNWSICFNDENILAGLKKDMMQGIRSSSFREMLSYAFEINIRYYTIKNGKYFATDCHNPFARETLHLLYENGNTYVMEIDENHSELLHMRQMYISDYKCVLQDVSLLDEESILQYVEQKRYLAKDKLSTYSHRDDIKDIEQIMFFVMKSYNDERKVQNLKLRLNKISSQFIGENNTLYYLMKRFSVEGVQISYEELCYLINNIIFYALDDYDEHTLICWILVTHDQKNWMLELLFLKLQNYFKQSLSNEIKNWRQFSSHKTAILLLLINLDQHDKICVTVDHLNDIFNYLHDIPKFDTTDLEGLCLSEWPNKLKQLFYQSIISKKNYMLSMTEITTLSHIASLISNSIGNEKTKQFLNILLSHNLDKSCLFDVLNNFEVVCQEVDITSTDITSLENQEAEMWMKELLEKHLELKNDRNYSDLIKLIKSEHIKREDLEIIIKNLSKKECKAQEGMGIYEQIKKMFANNLNAEQWLNMNLTTYEDILLIIDEVIKLKKGYNLRAVQKLSVMMLLKNESVLAQISTGEGKSLIIVAFAIAKVRKGEKLHVVTSSTVLAERDAKINNEIFEFFGISVGHNCYENIDKRKEIYSNCNVVFGELSYFQRDYLLDTFFGKNILGDNKFDNVIIDEVDSMLVDKGNNMLYLSHEIAGFDKLESVYIFIWNWINAPVKSADKFDMIFNENDIHNVVLHEIYDIIDEEDLQSIDSVLTKSEVTSLWLILIDLKILDSKGKIITKAIAKTDLDAILPEQFKTYSSRLSFLLRSCINRPRDICLPNYLKLFVELHLNKWIKSAITALFMKEFQSYVIDVDRSGTSSDRNPIVVILDTDTGTDQTNCQWDEALHQFLQLKHGCKLTMQSLKSVYISNVSYFKLYKNKFGVTGTLGSEQELSLLRNLHEVITVTIPTSKPKRFTLHEPILCKTIDLWIEEIKNEAVNIVKEKFRSILIICETMREVNLLQGELGDMIKVVTYTRDYEEFAEKENLSCGTAIIATNLAGRGTDIKLSRELCERGGLHVCMTYLPENCRVEEQGFGRSARRGEMGSGRLIVISDETDIANLREKRDKAELRRVSEIKSYYDGQIRTEEDYFKQFTEVYKSLKDKVKHLKFSTILLDSCLDKWAMWLDSISIHVNNIEDEQSKICAKNSLNRFLSEINNYLNSDFSKWVAHNPMRMAALGRSCILDKNYDTALYLFNEIISKEPKFCETAYYYKALICRNHKKDIAGMEKSLIEASKLFNHHINQLIIYSNIVDRIKDTTNIGLVQIQSYNEQKQCLCEIYSAYLQSIDNILGSSDVKQHFSEIDYTVFRILHKDLIEQNILGRHKINDVIDSTVLIDVATEFKIPVQTLINILNDCNGETDERSIKNEFKSKLDFCSKENFWKQLCSKNIIQDEVIYVSMKKSEFKSNFGDVYDLVKQDVKGELLGLLPRRGVIFFDIHKIRANIYDDDCLILEEDDLITIIHESNYNLLKENNLVSCNYMGIIYIEKSDSVFLNLFDSVTKQDFLNNNIPDLDASLILHHLNEIGILAKDKENKNIYRLKNRLTEIESITLPCWKLYEETIMQTLSIRFSYRNVLREIQKQVEEGDEILLPEFISQPHQLLYCALVENGIIKQGRVSFTSEERLKKYIFNLEMGIIEKRFLEETLENYVGNNDPNICDEIWEELLQQQWIELSTKKSKTYIIKYSNMGKNKLIKYLEYEPFLKFELTIKNVLKLHSDAVHDNLKKLNAPDIKKNDLKLGISSGLTDYLYGCEEMQILRLSGLDEFISLKQQSYIEKFLRVSFGLCKIIAGIMQDTVNTINEYGTREISSGLFCSGYEDMKLGLFNEVILWRDYIKHKMTHFIHINKNYFERFLHRKGNTTIDNGKIRRVVSHVSKSLQVESYTRKFLKNICCNVSKIIMENFEEVAYLMNNGHENVDSNTTSQEEFQFLITNYLSNKVERSKFVMILNDVKSDIILKIKETFKSVLIHESYQTKLQNEVDRVKIDHKHLHELITVYENLMNDAKVSDLVISTLHLKQTIREIFGSFLEEYLTGPIVSESSEIINKILIKRDLEAFDSIIYRNLSEDDVKLRNQLYERRKKSETSAQMKKIKYEHILTYAYNREISKLLERVRKISLFAELIKENASFNEIYLKIFVQAVPKILNLNNLTIYVENNENNKYIMDKTLQSKTVVRISLVNGKLQLYDNGFVENFKQFINCPNNLYDALSKNQHDMMSQERFAELVAEYIENNTSMISIIQNIWTKIDSENKIRNDKQTKDLARDEFNYDIDDIKLNLKAIVAKKLSCDDSGESIELDESDESLS